MNNQSLVIAGGNEQEHLTRGLYSFYHSIRNNKYRYGSPFDFMEFQMGSKSPLYDEQYTLFAIAFLDNTLSCSPAKRLLLGIGALYSLEKITSNPYFRDNIPYFLELACNLRSLISQFSWEEINRICKGTFPEIEVIKILSQYKIDVCMR